MKHGANCADCVPSYTRTTYDRACKKIFIEDRYTEQRWLSYFNYDEECFTQNYKILFGYFKNRSYALSVGRIDDVVSQFETQERCWREDKIKQEKQYEEELRKNGENQLRKLRERIAKQQMSRFITCGDDIIDIFKVESVIIRIASPIALYLLEREYFGKERDRVASKMIYSTGNELKKYAEKAHEIDRKIEEFNEKYEGKSILTISLRGEEKKYLEGYCGFDIFTKKKEFDYAYAGYRKQIQKVKELYISSIVDEFNSKQLLTSSTLTNKDKLREYTAVREFCFKYIPLLENREFKVDVLAERYPYHISKDACNLFKENWISLSRSCSGLRRGEQGEEKVHEVLRLFDDRYRILKGVVLGKCEHDFIVITPYGISTIEVKNLRGDYVLTETGALKCISNPKAKTMEIAIQSKRHLETLRRLLNGCPAFTSAVPLQEIICSAECNYTIKDHYRHIPICYYSTIDKYLIPAYKKIVLSPKAMIEIEKFLLANRGDAHKYDVFLPRGEIDNRESFIKNFADIASGYIVAQQANEEQLQGN